jgi:hypothetical protein
MGFNCYATRFVSAMNEHEGQRDMQNLKECIGRICDFTSIYTFLLLLRHTITALLCYVSQYKHF